MTDLPPALAERRAELMRLIGVEQDAIFVAEEKAQTARLWLAKYDAELRGIDIAAEAFAAMKPPLYKEQQFDPPPKERRPRRDIRALVKGYYDRTFEPQPELCAAHIGCRVSQVEAALRAINGAGAEE